MRLLLTALTTALLGITAIAQQPASTALTPRALEGLLSARPQGAEADQLAARVRTTFGADALARGAAPQIDELQVAWALEVPPPAGTQGGQGGQGGRGGQGGQGRPPRVVSDGGGFNLPLNRIGTTNVYAATTTLSHGTAFTWHYEVADRRLGGGQLEV